MVSYRVLCCRIYLINSWNLVPYIIILSISIFLIGAFVDAIRSYIVKQLHLDVLLTSFNTFLFIFIVLPKIKSS